MTRTDDPATLGRTFTIEASDGFTLAATRFSPPASAPPAAATIIVAGATGVQQRFYRRFAEYAATQGYEVVTFDYRGIGGSAPPRLREFRMDFGDWARLDLEAVITTMRDARPLFIVGHSYGGVAFGLVPSINAVDAIYTFGSGAGWHGWMPRLEAARVLALWHIVGPLTTRATGVMPGAMIGLGSDMPLGVYRGWKRWTSFPRFFFDDPRMVDAARTAERIRIPVAAANATDDRWALPRSRDALMSGYRAAELTRIDIAPSDHGLRAIGHVGYFRPTAQPLWANALRWLDAQQERVAAAG